MTKHQIVEEIAREPKYKNFCKIVTSGHPEGFADDLYQELFVFLMEMDEAKLKRIYSDNFDNYYFVMAARQVNCSSSRFFRQNISPAVMMRKHLDRILAYQGAINSPKSDFPADDMRLFKRAMEELEQSDFVGARLLQMHSERKSMKQVSKDAGVPIRSVYKYIENARETVKIKIERYKRTRK